MLTANIWLLPQVCHIALATSLYDAVQRPLQIPSIKQLLLHDDQMSPATEIADTCGVPNLSIKQSCTLSWAVGGR